MMHSAFKTITFRLLNTRTTNLPVHLLMEGNVTRNLYDRLAVKMLSTIHITFLRILFKNNFLLNVLISLAFAQIVKHLFLSSDPRKVQRVYKVRELL